MVNITQEDRDQAWQKIYDECSHEWLPDEHKKFKIMFLLGWKSFHILALEKELKQNDERSL